MSSDVRLDGEREVETLFDALPAAAQDELSVRLGKIGAGVLALQQALAPVRTGKTRRSLTVKEELEKLRVKIGIFSGADLGTSKRKGLSGLFYARIQNYGRRAQTVWVTRGTLASPKSATTRRKHNLGGLRKPYALRVRAMPGRHFVDVQDRIGDVADRYLARFWDDVKAKAGAGGMA